MKISQNEFSMAKQKPILTLLFGLMLPFFAFSQVENAKNGIDDDGDGLIDCFDPDVECTGDCADFFYQTCLIPCSYHPPCDSISLEVQWEGTDDVGDYPVLVAGDMDGDGMPEVVVAGSNRNFLSILDGSTGMVKHKITINSTFEGGTAPAIGDVDMDGFAEVFVVTKDRLLRCFSFNLIEKWVGPQQVGYDIGYETPVVNLADMDQNGIPEIIIGNQIFSSINGNLLASGGNLLSKGEHPKRAGKNSFCSIVAMDVLPDSFGPDCEGLEIVAGNQVLTVNLVAGTVKMAVQATGNYTDGYTSLADFDQDGDLDAVVQGQKGTMNTCFVWDLKTGTILRSYQLLNNYIEGASRVNVGNYDADPAPEISFISQPRIYCLDNNFSLKWSKPIVDFSAVTCSSVFDFCGDGSVDVVYRSGTKLTIFEGSNGATKWETPCASATHIESPLILDVDNDGQTEIVTTRNHNGNYNEGHVVVYQSLNSPGIASRKVWNQHAYFVTNVNDDLTIPRVQQNPNLVGDKLILNGFMNQYFDYRMPAPDADLKLNSLICRGDSLEISVKICNLGHKKLQPTTLITFYKGNPTTSAAPVLWQVPTGFSLGKDSCKMVKWTFPAIYNDSVFVVINDDGSKNRPFKLTSDFPSTTVGECDFTNNILGFYQRLVPPPLNLGKDTLVCDNGSTVLKAAGLDYVSWLWQDGSTAQTFSAKDPGGLFFVEIRDVCGFAQRDSIRIAVDSATVAQLGPDREVCLGDTIQIGEPGFDNYVWLPQNWAACATCPKTSFSPTATGKIVLQTALNNGCTSRDTLLVTVRDTFYMKRDTTICYGQSVTFNGIKIEPDKFGIFPFQSEFGCDSTIRLEVIGTIVGTYNLKLDSSVCLGNPLIINGINIAPTANHVFKLKTYLGCDSVVTIRNVPLDTFWTAEDRVICAGETSNIFGQNIGVSGTYQMVFSAENGCDSTHLVHLVVLPPITINFASENSCPQEATGVLTVSATSSMPPFSYNWAWPLADNSAVLENIPAGNYPVTVTDADGCTAVSSGNVAAFPEIFFAVEATDPSCHQEKNGQILVKTADPTVIWSLNGDAFGQDTLITNLPAGNFTVTAQDVFGCTATETAFLTDPPELLVKLPDDNLLKMGDSLALEIQTTSPDPLKYNWQPPLWLSCLDCPGPIARPFATVRWTLQITDSKGCTATDQMLLEIDQNPDIFFSNVLKINAERDNDKFQVFTGPQVGRIQWVRIFDRWGGQVYEAKDIAPGVNTVFWDGRSRGKTVASAVYVIAARLELVDGKVVEVKGDLTVVR